MLTVQQNTTKPFNIYFGKVGLTITTTLSKNGGAFNSVSPSIVDRSNGYYSISPIAAHRDTLGENAWLFSAASEPDLPRVEQVVLADVDAVAYGAPSTSAITSAIESSSIAKEATVNAVGSVVVARPTLVQIEASTVLAKEATITNRPTLSQIEASTVLAKEATVANRPTLAQIEASTVLATALQVETFVTASELNLEALLVDIPTVAEFNARSLPSADYFVVSDYTAPPSAATIVTQIEASTVLPTKTDVQNAGLI